MKALEYAAGRAVGPAALAALFVLYVAMRPLGGHVSDSYCFVKTIQGEVFGSFFHPHHVLYLPLAHLWRQAAAWAFPSVSLWASLAAMSAAFGAAGVAAAFLTLRTLGARQLAAAAGAVLVAVSFGYWFFSSDVKGFVLSACSALWCFYLLARFVTGGQARFAWWAGVAAAFAALFHQTGIFLFAPAAVVFFREPRRVPALKAMLLFLAAFAALVAPVYIAAGWAAAPSFTPSGFLRWLFKAAVEGHGGFTAGGVARAPVGFARGVVGGLMAFDAARGACGASAWLWAGVASAVAAFVLGAAAAVRAATRLHGASPQAKTLAAGLLSAFAVYGFFSVYFDPGNFEWWTIPTALLAVAAAIPLVTGARPAAATAALLALLVFVANLSLDFQYRRQPQSDFARNAARGVLALAAPQDVIVTPSLLGSLMWYERPDASILCPDEIRRFSSVPEMDEILRVEALASAASGGRVLIAGAQGDPDTARYVKHVLGGLIGRARTVGTIRFLDGGRRFVATVSDVPVLAVEPSVLAEALSGSRIAAPGGG